MIIDNLSTPFQQPVAIAKQVYPRITTQIRHLAAAFFRSFQVAESVTREQKTRAFERIQHHTNNETFTHRMSLLSPACKIAGAFASPDWLKLAEFSGNVGDSFAKDALNSYGSSKNLTQHELSELTQTASTDRNSLDKILETMRQIQQAERRNA